MKEFSLDPKKIKKILEDTSYDGSNQYFFPEGKGTKKRLNEIKENIYVSKPQFYTIHNNFPYFYTKKDIEENEGFNILCGLYSIRDGNNFEFDEFYRIKDDFYGDKKVVTGGIKSNVLVPFAKLNSNKEIKNPLIYDGNPKDYVAVVDPADMYIVRRYIDPYKKVIDKKIKDSLKLFSDNFIIKDENGLTRSAQGDVEGFDGLLKEILYRERKERGIEEGHTNENNFSLNIDKLGLYEGRERR